MKQTLFAVFACLLISAFSSSAFAGIRLEGYIGDLSYNHENPIVAGQISHADYFYRAGKQFLVVTIHVDKNNPAKQADFQLGIEFTDGDIPFGLTLANSIDKDATLFFSNANFDIEQIMVGKHAQHQADKKLTSRLNMSPARS